MERKYQIFSIIVKGVAFLKYFISKLIRKLRLEKFTFILKNVIFKDDAFNVLKGADRNEKTSDILW